MKTVITGRLTLAYLRKLDRHTYFATGFAALILTVSLLWMIFHIGGDTITGDYANIIYSVGLFFAVFSSGWTVYRASRPPLQLSWRHRLTWLLIGTGCFFDACGGIYYTYLAATNQNPFPSYGDICFQLFYPFAFAGLLLIPTTLPLRKRMALDALVTTLCLLGVCWTFVIGPSYFAGVAHANSPLELVKLAVGISYPCLDMLLILAILLLFQRRVQPSLYPSLILFGIGIFALCWADAAYAYTNIFTDSYASGTPYIDPFWLLGSLAVGLTARYQYNALARSSYTERVHQHPQDPDYTGEIELPELDTHPRGWRLPSLTIYLPLILLLGLTVYYEMLLNGPVAHFLVLLTAIVGILLTARFLITTHENETLLHEREQLHRESELLRHLSTELTAILDMEPLLERVVHQVTSALHFDDVMLLLKEERYHLLDQQAHILVYAALANTPGVSRWRSQGDNNFYRTILAGKVVEVSWNTNEQDMADINLWRLDHQIEHMLFLPLKFQQHVLGSLGIARRKVPHLDQHTVTLAQTFADQVSTVIEHAHLYREAHEHEAFARAMANIAARLNAAVVDPLEIYQLICVEAANALRADYSLLYVPHKREQLFPLAVYTTDQKMTPRDWPLIDTNEEASVEFQALQPFLLQLRATENGAPTLATTRQKPYNVAASTHTPSDDTAKTFERHHPHTQTTLSWREQFTNHFVYTVIIIPLIAEGTTVGILILGRSLPPGIQDKRSLDLSDLPYAQDFAEQAAVAFMNAQLYHRLRSAHQRLQEVDKLKDQFMITASHELRTPLTAVQGYIELLAHFDEILPQEQRQEFLQKAQRSCDELVVLLGNVMDASRLEIEAGIKPAHMELVSVQEIVNGIIDLLQPQLTQENRKIHTQISTPIYVQADPIRLRQVLLNISANALKYSPTQTPITFSARSFMGRPPYAVISIADKGKGISTKDQARLFQRFVRLESDINSPVRGSGLGLYISRRLIEAMNGKIWIESRGIPGEGTTFHIQLPLAPSPSLNVPPGTRGTSGPSRTPGTTHRER